MVAASVDALRAARFARSLPVVLYFFASAVTGSRLNALALFAFASFVSPTERFSVFIFVFVVGARFELSSSENSEPTPSTGRQRASRCGFFPT